LFLQLRITNNSAAERCGSAARPRNYKLKATHRRVRCKGLLN
jgi:hypothetical protein